MFRKLLLGGVFTLAVAGTSLAADEGKQVRYRELPAEVKATVDKERGNHELKGIYLVEGKGQDFYRIIIDEKGNDKVIRVGPKGKLLSEAEVKDPGGDNKTVTVGERVKYGDLPADVKATIDKERKGRDLPALWNVKREGAQDFYRAIIDGKKTDRVIRVAPDGRLLSTQTLKAKEAEVLGVKKTIKVARDASDAERVDFDRLPGPVKTKIGALAKGDEVQDVIRYKQDGKVMYRAEVGEGKYTRFINVSETADVAVVRGEVDPGVVVPFDRTPGAVKGKIGALAKSGKVDEVIKYERGGKTYFQAEVEDTKGKHFFFIVDDKGNEVEELPD